MGHWFAPRLFLVLVAASLMVGGLPAVASSAVPGGSTAGRGFGRALFDDDLDEVFDDEFERKPLSPETAGEAEPDPSGLRRSGPVGESERGVDTDAVTPFGKLLPPGMARVELPARAGRNPFGDGVLSVLVDPGVVPEGVAGAKLRVDEAEGLARPTGALSDLFRVDLVDGAGVRVVPDGPLRLEVDFAGHASNLNSGLASRLTVAEFSGCRSELRLIDEEAGEEKPVTVCGSVVPLEAEVDRAGGKLVVSLERDGAGRLVGSGGASMMLTGEGWLGILAGSGYDAGAY